MKSFDCGRFVAYGAGPDGPRVGLVEDGSVYSDNGTWQFRIDGSEVYGLGGDLCGFVDDGGIASTKSGQFMFRLEED